MRRTMRMALREVDGGWEAVRALTFADRRDADFSLAETGCSLDLCPISKGTNQVFSRDYGLDSRTDSYLRYRRERVQLDRLAQRCSPASVVKSAKTVFTEAFTVGCGLRVWPYLGGCDGAIARRRG
jgi:hypothetical protein